MRKIYTEPQMSAITIPGLTLLASSEGGVYGVIDNFVGDAFLLYGGVDDEGELDPD